MDKSGIDELLAMLGHKTQEESEETNDSMQQAVPAAEYDNEEFVNFVLGEIIQGRESLDLVETPATISSGSSSSEAVPVTDNAVPLSQSTNSKQSQIVANDARQNNSTQVTASYLLNGEQVFIPVMADQQQQNVMVTNSIAAAVASPVTGVASPSTPATFSSPRPAISTTPLQKQVIVPMIVDQQQQNVVFTNAFAASPIVANPQKMVIANGFPALQTSVPQPHARFTLAVSGNEVPTPTPQPAPQPTPEAASAENKKRKLYEETHFDDPVMEKRRRNAQNAKNHRDKTKLKIQELSEKLEDSHKEKEDALKEVERLKTEIESLKVDKAKDKVHLEELKKEIQTLREQNAILRVQEQSIVQQDKLGFLNFDLI